MPYINIRTAGRPLSREQRQRLIEGATELMATIMRKKAELTSVRIEHTDADAWGIGGAPFDAAGGSAAHMDIKVTAQTNTNAEKAAMIEAGHKLLAEVLGALPEATYVVIHDLPGENWGYAGQTQAARAKARQAA